MSVFTTSDHCKHHNVNFDAGFDNSCTYDSLVNSGVFTMKMLEKACQARGLSIDKPIPNYGGGHPMKYDKQLLANRILEYQEHNKKGGCCVMM